jgi:serine protease Do
MLGIEAEALRGQMAEFFGTKEGVLVRSVMKDSPAAKAGLKAGDVILKIDDTTVGSPSDVTAAVRSMRDKKGFPITILRDRKELTVTAAVEDDRSDWHPGIRHINGSVRM